MPTRSVVGYRDRSAWPVLGPGNALSPLGLAVLRMVHAAGGAGSDGIDPVEVPVGALLRASSAPHWPRGYGRLSTARARGLGRTLGKALSKLHAAGYLARATPERARALARVDREQQRVARYAVSALGLAELERAAVAGAARGRRGT